MRSEAEVIERVRSAYEPARFEPSYTDVVSRARRRGPVAVGLAVAATAAALALVVGLGWRPARTQPADTLQVTFATACARLWSTLAYGDDRLPEARRTGPPPAGHVFSLEDGALGLRVYVDDAVMFACRRDEGAHVAGRIDPHFMALAGDASRTVAVLDPSGGPEYYVGRLAVPADRVLARRLDGGTSDGVIRDGVFVIWAPRGGLAGATVEAYRGDELTTRGLPRFLAGAYDADVFAEVCDALIRADRFGRPGLSDVERNTLPPLRATMVAEEYWLRLYGTTGYMAACSRVPEGAVGTHVYTSPDDTWESLQYMSALGTLSYVFGAAPAGAESVEVHLDDGRVLDGRLSGGYFFVGFRAATGVRVVKIVAYTPDTVHETGRGGVHTRPR